MLKEQIDIDRLDSLIISMNKWSLETNNSIVYSEFEKDSESLYRFGWFVINDYKYSISTWKFRKHIVVFENEDTGEKIKYNIQKYDTIDKKFTKDYFVIKLIKRVRILLSQLLRKMSDGLHP